MAKGQLYKNEYELFDYIDIVRIVSIVQVPYSKLKYYSSQIISIFLPLISVAASGMLVQTAAQTGI